jgi:addiction module RelB/DinJ family antitoxin
MDMRKTGYVTARIEPKLKAPAARVLANVGVSTTDAITMFFRQVVLRNGLPFEVRVPNAETKRAIEDLQGDSRVGIRRRRALRRHHERILRSYAREAAEAEGMKALVESAAFRKDLKRAHRLGKTGDMLECLI